MGLCRMFMLVICQNEKLWSGEQNALSISETICPLYELLIHSL